MKDYFKIAFNNLRNRKLRTWLTMIGIFIGIAAVVALVSVGQGLEQAVTQQFRSLGKDVLIIRPKGAGFGPQGGSTPSPLTTQDQAVVERTNGVMETTSLVYRSARITFKDEVNYQLITGLPLQRPSVRDLAQRATTMEVKTGRNLASGDKFDALAGYSYSQEEAVFAQAVRVGDKIKIRNTSFDVVGILEQMGTSTDDKQLVIPMETAEKILEIKTVDGHHIRDYIAARVNPSMDVQAVRDAVARNLRNERDVEKGNENFQIETAQDLQQSFNTIIGLVQGVLIGIAAISLLVGGINIMNTMYTSVLQRTKDIGVMKAIGARNGDVLQLFLIESALLGFSGGVIGVMLGYGISRGVSVAVARSLGQRYMITYFPLWLVVGSLAFSTVVGTVSGVFPALRASNEDPVDALRYE